MAGPSKYQPLGWCARRGGTSRRQPLRDHKRATRRRRRSATS